MTRRAPNLFSHLWNCQEDVGLFFGGLPAVTLLFSAVWIHKESEKQTLEIKYSRLRNLGVNKETVALWCCLRRICRTNRVLTGYIHLSFVLSSVDMLSFLSSVRLLQSVTSEYALASLACFLQRLIVWLLFCVCLCVCTYMSVCVSYFQPRFVWVVGGYIQYSMLEWIQRIFPVNMSASLSGGACILDILLCLL